VKDLSEEVVRIRKVITDDVKVEATCAGHSVDIKRLMDIGAPNAAPPQVRCGPSGLQMNRTPADRKGPAQQTIAGGKKKATKSK
jgi:hypothetical protein